MLPGVYPAKRKDGTPYFRAGIHYKNKHISLGSYTEESLAHNAYSQADSLLHDSGISLETALFSSQFLSFEKNEEDKFDIDDLFFYSQHKILRRGGRLFVNEYGMQTSIFSRYGIPSHGVPGRDFTFANGDSTDLRYSNVILLNSCHVQNGMVRFKARIHINGNYIIGSYSTSVKAAVAYNKAVDLAKRHGIAKNFPENYVEELSAKEYAELYTKIKISKKFLAYLDSMSSISD